MESTDIFNYVRKLELENGALKTAVAEYRAEEENRKHLFESAFGFLSTSPEKPAENITPEKSESKLEGTINGIIICN